MDNASTLLLILPLLLTSDVEPGTGKTKSAFSAQRTGLSIPIKSAFLFLTNAALTMPLVPALLASRVTT